MRNRMMFTILSACLGWAVPAVAQQQPCGTIDVGYGIVWIQSNDRVQSWATTERSVYWAVYCGGGLQSESWIEGYSGYGVGSTTQQYARADWIVEPSFTGTHVSHSKHWYIAPNLQWYFLLEGLDTTWAENFCEPRSCPIEGSVWDPIACECTQGCPLILDTDGNGFRLTSRQDGVLFDLNSDGMAEQVSWTEADSDDGWLVMDRNRNGKIDNGSELFGNFTSATSNSREPIAEHGFQALRALEGPTWGASVPDGVIDRNDAAFPALQIWRDVNHNGISEPDELKPLAEFGVVSLESDYRPSRHHDEFGNLFKLKAEGHWLLPNGKLKKRAFYDVWLLIR